MSDKPEKKNMQVKLDIEKDFSDGYEQLEMLKRLSIAAKYKDDDTGSHITRMSRYCYEIAKTYGFSEEDALVLLNAAPMHDIGKIGIADSILLKKGKLTEDEFKAMTAHSKIGADIINEHDSKLLKVAYLVAYQHHEKFNGKGYPNQLSGEEIDINARIAAVADVFDALTSVRPYKKAWSFEKAVKQINDDSGTHFDPAVVEAFNKSLDTIKRVKEEFDS
ncbi:MAG: HD domain-containing phosphohydrolase [Eubacteriales bacterium]